MNAGYHDRLGLMEDWYRELLSSDEGERVLLAEYSPHARFLGALRGSVIDIGGGAGVAARFLHPSVSYVVVDPSEVWNSPEWLEFGRKFRGSGPDPKFVASGGEALPFPDQSFDWALSFWSLNHADQPKQCVSEMLRVLKSGGSARIILEDVEPSWPELLDDAAKRLWSKISGSRYRAVINKRLIRALWMKLAGRWDLQPDHIRISDAQLSAWLRGNADVKRREWVDEWLVYDIVKR